MKIWRLLLYLFIGMVAMLIPIMAQGFRYRIKNKKCFLVAFLLTIIGTFGTFLLFFVENGRFGGTSFYGAIFLVPILFIPLAYFLRSPYDELMDLCAPAECVMLAVMKIQCLTTGCCGGRQIHIFNIAFVFPSQIVELINALMIGTFLFLMSRNRKLYGRLYPWYMVIYGVSRFILNLFRNVKNMSALPIPAGNLWSIVSIVLGAVWLILLRRKRAILEKGNVAVCQ